MSGLNGASGPLCPAGRCAAILRGLAEARSVERLAEQQGETLAAVISAVLDDLGVDVGDDRVRTVVAAAIRRVAVPDPGARGAAP